MELGVADQLALHLGRRFAGSAVAREAGALRFGRGDGGGWAFGCAGVFIGILTGAEQGGRQQDGEREG